MGKNFNKIEWMVDISLILTILFVVCFVFYIVVKCILASCIIFTFVLPYKTFI